MAMIVERVPSPMLAPFVRSISCYLATEATGGRERIMPSGRPSLMVNLHEDEFRTYDGPHGLPVRRIRGAMLAGPHSAPTVIDTAEQRCVVTVSFATGGAAPFFGVPLSEAHNQIVDLGDLWGRDGAVLRERMCEAPTPAGALSVLDAVLCRRLAEPRPEPAVTFAAGALERGAAVSVVSARVGWPPKRFVREFRALVGLSPKRFGRVSRLQRVLAGTHRTGPVDWAEVAVRHGYFDQAHLINDFRALTGITPAAYLRAVGSERNHVPTG